MGWSVAQGRIWKRQIPFLPSLHMCTSGPSSLSFLLSSDWNRLINHLKHRLFLFSYESLLPYMPGPPICCLCFMVLEGCLLLWNRSRELLSTAIFRGSSAHWPGMRLCRGPKACQHFASARWARRDSAVLKSRECSLKPTPVWPVMQVLSKLEKLNSASYSSVESPCFVVIKDTGFNHLGSNLCCTIN